MVIVNKYIWDYCVNGTAYNKQYALRRRQAAAQGSKNRSRRKAALCGFLSPTFQPTANLRFAL